MQNRCCKQQLESISDITCLEIQLESNFVILKQSTNNLQKYLHSVLTKLFEIIKFEKYGVAEKNS